MINNKLAIIFPGQSSEHIGMLSKLSIHYRLIKDTFSEVSESLGYDIWKLIQQGPIDMLHQTRYAQPAVLTASVAIWKVWRSKGGQIPNVMAGHSLGEYSALVCSNSIDLLSAVKLVTVRGMLMQKASPYAYGAMSVIIGLDSSVVLEFCKRVESQCNLIVAPAGLNGSNNIVISGHKEAVYKVNMLCKNAKAKYVAVLPISVASHCNLMKPIINQFRIELEKIVISSPNIPVINNTDVHVLNTSQYIRSSLVRQLYTPVRWNDIIQKIINNNINNFLEMGPGKVLTRLIQSSMKNVFSISINDLNSLEEAIKISNN